MAKRWTMFDMDLLRRLMKEYLKVRPYTFGDYYALTPHSLDTKVWAGWQFDRPDLGEGMVQMFRTNVSLLNIVDATPFQRDSMEELAQACRKHHLKLCFYYSHGREGRHPLAHSFENGNNYGNSWDFVTRNP